MRSVKHASTVMLPGLSDRPDELQAVLSVLVRRTPDLLQGTAPLSRIDGLADGRFATETADGVLWYAVGEGRIWLEGETPAAVE